MIIDPGGPAMIAMPPAIDTLHYVIDFNDTVKVCIDSALQLLNNVGMASICQQGTNVKVVVTNNDSCITLQPNLNYSGNDTLCVVHCDNLSPTFCDTTYLVVRVKPNDATPPPPAPAPKDTLHFVLNYNEVTNVCIDSALQLVNNVGPASILSNGTNVTVAVSNNDSCVTLTPATNFIGTDTIRVIHCDAVNTSFCDTTMLIVQVNGPPPCFFEFLLEDSAGTYKVRLVSDTTLAFPLNLTSSILVAIRVPSGGFTVSNDSITTLLSGTFFENTGGVLATASQPDYDYIYFDINSPIEVVYIKGDTLDLFTFKGSGCVGDSIHLVGTGASFPNPTIGTETVTSFLSISAFLASGGTPFCVNSTGLAICDPDTTQVMDCVIQFDLEYMDGVYKVSMTPDTTFPLPTFVSGLTRAMNITLRAPTGKLQIVNSQDFNTGYEFRLKNTLVNPVETPGYDYFLFGLKESSTPTIFIPYNKGVKVDLFSFQNFDCSLDSLALVGNGAAFITPSIGGEIS